jgi:DNA-binding transcriptional LysR family regulator
MGRVFLAHAKDVLDGAEALDREVALMRGAASGSLVLGAGTILSAISVERALAAFVARHPGVAIRVVNDSGSDLLGRLRIGEIDLYAGSLPVGADRDGLALVPLRTRTARFYARPGHPLASRRHLTVDEVLRATLVGPTRLPPQFVERILKARGGEDAGAIFAFACESVSMMRMVARESDHVLLGTPSMVADDLIAGHLVALRIDGQAPVQDFGVVRLSGRTLPPTADLLVESIVAADAASDDAEIALETEVAAAVAPR